MFQLHEEFNEWCEPWNYALVLTVLGKRFSVYLLRDYFKKLWGDSSFELIDLPNNYFIVRFNDADNWRAHYREVLNEGPWVIKQHCALVQRWTPYFDPYSNPLRRVATWIRVPDVPVNCYNNHFMSRLGDRVGRTLRVDMNTIEDFEASKAKVERGKLARICVELDLQKRLIPRIVATGSVFNIEYEGLGVICFDCGRFGHRREECLWKCSSSSPGEETTCRSRWSYHR